jgi:hypothetical protein
MGKVFHSLGLGGGSEEGNLVVARFALHSGLRQQGRAFGPSLLARLKPCPFEILC